MQVKKEAVYRDEVQGKKGSKRMQRSVLKRCRCLAAFAQAQRGGTLVTPRQLRS